MTSIDDRIAQFENMATADPENDMAHFSLGNAYLQAGRAAEAAGSLERCTQLNPYMSKAYQLAGEAMVAAVWEDRAAKILLAGYDVAMERGDIMVQQDIRGLLEKLGVPIPEKDEAKTAAPVDTGFSCSRTGRPGAQLAEPPFRGPVGAWIQENISQETWQAWIGQGTKVINELRLDLSREEDARVYDENMCEFLGIDEALLNTGS